MTSRLGRLNKKIEKLLVQKEKVESVYIESISKIILKSVQEDIDIQIIAGIILDTSDIIKESPEKKEAWQEAGRKFLSRSNSKQLKSAIEEDLSIHQPM
jgi:hypothetical protein